VAGESGAATLSYPHLGRAERVRVLLRGRESRHFARPPVGRGRRKKGAGNAAVFDRVMQRWQQRRAYSSGPRRGYRLGTRGGSASWPVRLASASSVSGVAMYGGCGGFGAGMVWRFPTSSRAVRDGVVLVQLYGAGTGVSSSGAKRCRTPATCAVDGGRGAGLSIAHAKGMSAGGRWTDCWRYTHDQSRPGLR
jgi:hypothetical protein